MQSSHNSHNPQPKHTLTHIKRTGANYYRLELRETYVKKVGKFAENWKKILVLAAAQQINEKRWQKLRDSE